tara:strand:+ start:339 stop:548 length:210 start_codon:yes stop_codon:yes gene_type:complete
VVEVVLVMEDHDKVKQVDQVVEVQAQDLDLVEFFQEDLQFVVKEMQVELVVVEQVVAMKLVAVVVELGP